MTAEQSAEVLGYVKIRFGLQDETQDGLLTLYVRETGRRIMDYCNLRKMPDGLIMTWAAMTVDLVKLNEGENGDILGSGAVSQSNVKSISEGDASISMGADSSATAAALSGITDTYANEVLHNYLPSLHRWRRIAWG